MQEIHLKIGHFLFVENRDKLHYSLSPLFLCLCVLCCRASSRGVTDACPYVTAVSRSLRASNDNYIAGRTSRECQKLWISFMGKDSIHKMWALDDVYGIEVWNTQMYVNKHTTLWSARV